MQSLNLSDMKRQLGKWQSTAEQPAPGWHMLKKVPLWTSSITKLASLRRVLAQPMLVATSMVLDEACQGFADIGPLCESTYLAYKFMHGIPKHVEDFKVVGALWQVETGQQRPQHIIEAFDNGVPLLLWSTSHLRMQNEVGALRADRSDYEFMQMRLHFRSKHVPSASHHYMLDRYLCLCGPRRVLPAKVCRPSSPCG